ncbi:MAG: purine-nucleoside phosphorylase [Candidatus Caldatribacterium sp.]|nr:purine-nucleoside phosphorylase [Candidatus Caldatribacterium sp.]MDW8080767.1 purine-nucleoside phosphorylase [Candidatus Calescibacterium sp.]
MLRLLYPESILVRLEEVARTIAVRPQCAVVAGSGWGGYGEEGVEMVLSFSDLHPALRVGVLGHQGIFRFVRWKEKTFLFVEGRMHLYEGYGLSEILLPLAFGYFLGVRVVVLTNAAGSLSPFLPPGNILVLSDQIDWTFVPDALPRVRFDEELQEIALACARRFGLEAVRGVYVGVLGPSFETAAEVRMLEYLGGHAVGMSTVKEAKFAMGLGLKVLGLSLITNWGTGLSPFPLSHDEVLSLAELKRPVLHAFLRELVVGIPYEDCCES